MKKTILTLFATFLTFLIFGQVPENQKIIELGKTYKDFMFRNEPTKDILREIKSNVPENLRVATEFIVQTISTKNKLLTQPYLSRPDDKVLKQIYVIQNLVIWS